MSLCVCDPLHTARECIRHRDEKTVRAGFPRPRLDPDEECSCACHDEQERQMDEDEDAERIRAHAAEQEAS